jgi:solute carrier family 30 (zinc transporter), member 2
MFHSCRPSYQSFGEDTDERDSHCHDGQNDEMEALRKQNLIARRKLIIASILCLIFMIAEIVGGALANSLAIMTDAAHLLTDFASFMISLLALVLATRPATKRMSYGWHRAEVVGAMASVLLIWVVTGILVYLAVMRVISGQYEIDGLIMLITSSVGVVVNIMYVALALSYCNYYSPLSPKSVT